VRNALLDVLQVMFEHRHPAGNLLAERQRRGVSSNDVFPTAMHVAAVIALREQLIPQIQVLKKTLAGAVGQHFIHVHVGLGAGPGLPDG
jgi:hypothetical protein